MSPTAPTSSPAPTRGVLVLLGLGLAECALSLFQWLQLLTLRGGGATSCGISEHINCETVWNSPFASTVHGLLGMPVAALGLVWGLVAVGLCALYLVRNQGGLSVRTAANGLRLTAAAGLVACIVFAAASAKVGVLCPTCLATYVLTLAFVVTAILGLPGALLPQAGEWVPALGWAGGFTLAAYAALLLPGLNTPKASSGPTLPAAVTSTTAPGTPTLEGYLHTLSPEDQEVVAAGLADYRKRPPLPARSPARHLEGSPTAPVKMVEWTDSRCPPCRALVEELAVMKTRLPAGRLSLESRQFPLDSECNPVMPPQATDGSGTRCLAAKAQICLEGAPDEAALREKMFANQRALTTREAVLDVLSSGSVARTQLEACVANPDTARKVLEDILYAKQHDLRGTPLVIINGREAMANPTFLYALILASGDPNAEAFRTLPPPEMRAQEH